MSERQFAISNKWALAADRLQWLLQRRQGQRWASVSFVSSTRDILTRCMREKGCPPADAERLLAGLPSTFEEWAGKRIQTPATADLADGGGPKYGPPPAGAMKRPTLDEAEGRQFGWGLPWPRDGISACGRPGCPVCDAIPPGNLDRTEDKSRPAEPAR